jgi:dihydrofolate reductase
MVTHIHREYQADTFFPKIDPKEWYVSEQEDFFSEDPSELSFSYTTYLRRR